MSVWVRLFFCCCFLFQTIACLAQDIPLQTDIDTNMTIDTKKTRIGSVTFRAMRTGVSTGIFKTALRNGVLYVVDNKNKVQPYLIIRYEFSYMEMGSKYKTLACSGNLINEQVHYLVGEIPRFSTANIDKVYAIRMGTKKECRIGGVSLLKD